MSNIYFIENIHTNELHFQDSFDINKNEGFYIIGNWESLDGLLNDYSSCSGIFDTKCEGYMFNRDVIKSYLISNILSPDHDYIEKCCQVYHKYGVYEKLIHLMLVETSMEITNKDKMIKIHNSLLDQATPDILQSLLNHRYFYNDNEMKDNIRKRLNKYMLSNLSCVGQSESLGI